MECLFDKKKGRVIGTLIFNRDEILYDIQQRAYIDGSMLPKEAAHQRHMVQDIAQAGNRDIVLRSLDLAVAKCREMLYSYVKSSLTEAELDNVLKDPVLWGIVLDLPEDFSQSTFNVLGRTVHEYLVTYAIADYYEMVLPDKAALYHARAEETQSEIRMNLHARIARTRRRLHPF